MIKNKLLNTIYNIVKKNKKRTILHNIEVKNGIVYSSNTIFATELKTNLQDGFYIKNNDLDLFETIEKVDNYPDIKSFMSPEANFKIGFTVEELENVLKIYKSIGVKQIEMNLNIDNNKNPILFTEYENNENKIVLMPLRI